MHLLTTTSQPFGFWGSNLLLKAYRKACLHIKLYVYKDFKKQEETVLGPPVPGNVFLYRTPEQTQDVHRYPEDQRPPCDQDAVFDQIWGSFAVPVILADKSCVGVLEFLMDTPKKSYDEDIELVCKHLKHASLHPGNQIDPQRTNKISGRERKRTTKSSPLTKYSCLVPYFGLSKASAIEKLGHAGAVIKESTFKNLCRNVGIPMWPYVKKRTAGASIAPEPSSINQPVHEIDSSTGAPNIADSSNVCDIDQQLIQDVPNIDDTRDSFTGVDTRNGPPSFWAPQQTMYTQDIEIQDSLNQADTHRNEEAPFWPLEPSTYTGGIDIQDSFNRPDTRNEPPSFCAPQQTMYTQDIEIQDSLNQADTHRNEEAPFWPHEPSMYTGGIDIQDFYTRADTQNEPPSFWAPQQTMYTQDIEIQDSSNQADTHRNKEAPFWPLEPSTYTGGIDIQDSFTRPDTQNAPPSFWAPQQTMYTQDIEMQDSLNQADTQNEEAPFWPHEPTMHTYGIEIEDSFTRPNTRNEPPSFWAPQQNMYTQDIEIQDSLNQADTHRNEVAPFWPHEPSMYTGGIDIQDFFTGADTQNEEAPFWPHEPTMLNSGIEHFIPDAMEDHAGNNAPLMEDIGFMELDEMLDTL